LSYFAESFDVPAQARSRSQPNKFATVIPAGDVVKLCNLYHRPSLSIRLAMTYVSIEIVIHLAHEASLALRHFRRRSFMAIPSLALFEPEPHIGSPILVLETLKIARKPGVTPRSMKTSMIYRYADSYNSTSPVNSPASLPPIMSLLRPACSSSFSSSSCR
jgi:hypothetical protein